MCSEAIGGGLTRRSGEPTPQRGVEMSLPYLRKEQISKRTDCRELERLSGAGSNPVNLDEAATGRNDPHVFVNLQVCRIRCDNSHGSQLRKRAWPGAFREARGNVSCSHVMSMTAHQSTLASPEASFKRAHRCSAVSADRLCTGLP